MRSVITEEEFKANFQLAVILVGNDILIEDRIFDFNVEIPADSLSIRFKNCLFNNSVSFSPARIVIDVEDHQGGSLLKEGDTFFKLDDGVEIQNEIWFSDKCEFKQPIDLVEVTFLGKFLIHDSEINFIKFNNTKFQSLADFWKTTFIKAVTFYKTDFNSTVVFSASTFKNNVLFTYTLLAGKSIFSRTKFKKGFDFSQAIIAGDLQLFNLKFDFEAYNAVYVDNDDYEYQNAIDTLNIIPVINKKETFRILKHYFLKNGNFIDAIKYRVYEFTSYKQLLNEVKKDVENKEKNFGNRWILRLNWLSNAYGVNYWKGARFTVTAAVLFVFLIITSTFAFIEQWCLCPIKLSLLPEAFEYFVTILNPVHRLTYLDSLHPSIFTYLLDFLSRIVIGYGIYQTVQAFRKYK